MFGARTGFHEGERILRPLRAVEIRCEKPARFTLQERVNPGDKVAIA